MAAAIATAELMDLRTVLAPPMPILSTAAVEEPSATEQQNDDDDDDERVCIHGGHYTSDGAR